MDASIIIVNFNTKKILKKCLSSIFELTKEIEFEVIVVDNASSDSSVEMIEKFFPKVKIIANRKNLGFGSANNQGIKKAQGKYVCFLNSDVVLVENSLGKLIKISNKHSQVGIYGPKLVNVDKTIQQSAGFFPNLPQVFLWMTFIDDLPFGKLLKPYHVDHDSFYQEEQKVDWVTGAAMMVRKEVFERVGGFDEKIFLYGEEVELCYRVKKAGFSIFYTPVTKLIHIGRASMDKSDIGAITGEYKAILYFYEKYKSYLSRIIVFALLEFGALLRILIFGLCMGKKDLRRAYWMAFVHPSRLTLNGYKS
jgi:hypothetical protein